MMNILISLADMILLETPEDSKGLEILEGSTKDCPSYLYPYKYCVFQAPVQWCAWETFSPAECNNLPCSMTIILIDWISAILTVRSDPFQFLSFWHFFFSHKVDGTLFFKVSNYHLCVRGKCVRGDAARPWGDKVNKIYPYSIACYGPG